MGAGTVLGCLQTNEIACRRTAARVGGKTGHTVAGRVGGTMAELKASDLPSELRKDLLDQVRSRIGNTKYQELVDSAGEDEIIEALFVGSADQPEPPPSAASKVADFFTTVLTWAICLAVVLGFFWSAGNWALWYGKVIFGVTLGPFVYFHASDSDHWFAILMVWLAGLASIVFILWGLIQWLVSAL